MCNILPRCFFFVVFALSIIAGAPNDTVWAWDDLGHEIVAIVAADNLSPTAREHIAKTLGTNSDVVSLERAMAIASLRPDHEFRDKDPSTARWHFIDICLQDQRRDLPARCPGGACVTAKIDEYARRLKEGNCDKWGGDGDLAFLIHLVGDIHQPLHAATDADKGGNCIAVNSTPYAPNLHAAWDIAVVEELEKNVHSENALAHKLEHLYAQQKTVDSWEPGETENFAWESHQIASFQIYERLSIPLRPCKPEVHNCTLAPRGAVNLDSAYMSNASAIAAEQLVKAGFRLASLLNQIWPGGSTRPSCREREPL